MSKKIIFLIETHGTGFRNVTINPKKKNTTPFEVSGMKFHKHCKKFHSKGDKVWVIFYTK